MYRLHSASCIWRRATWTNFLNTKGGIVCLLHPVPHGAAERTLVELIVFFGKGKIEVVWLWTDDGNLLQPTGCVDGAPSRVSFSRICMHSFQCRTWRWLGVSCARHPCVIRMLLSWYSSTLFPLLCTLHRHSLIFSFSSSSSSSSMWLVRWEVPMRTSANEELGSLAENNLLTLSSTFRGPGVPPIWNSIAICSERSWRYLLGHWSDRVWRTLCAMKKDTAPGPDGIP